MIEIARGVPVVPTEQGYRDHVVAVPQPAVGQLWTYPLPAHASVRSICLRYVASGTVATRTPGFTFTDPNGIVLWRGGYSGNVTAGQSQFLSAGIGELQQGLFAGCQTIPLPDLWLSRYSNINMLAGAIDAGDQISVVALVLRLHHRAFEE